MKQRNELPAEQGGLRGRRQLLPEFCRRRRHRRHAPVARDIASVLLCAFVAVVAGCSFLKPAESTARHFVLTPISSQKPSPGDSGIVGLGIAQVHVPAYLYSTSLVVRKGANEVEYLPTAFWAERLDKGLQRVIAANLAGLMNVERVQLSAWQKDEVAAEVHVAVEQFEVEASGRGVLAARWSIVSPGGDKTLQSGSSRLFRPGPAPDSGAPVVVATLSELAGELSRELAQALKASVPVRRAVR